MHPLEQAQKSDAFDSLLTGSGFEPEEKPRVPGVIPFHGGSQPIYDIQNEKPIHRVMAFMAARGIKPKQIAEEVGYSYAQVIDIHRQPWFKERVSQILAENNNESLQALLDGGASDAIMQLRDLCNSAKSENVRLAAARDILDRTHGKPLMQKDVDGSKEIPADPADELARIREELEQLKNDD